MNSANQQETKHFPRNVSEPVSMRVERFAERHEVSVPTVFRWLKNGQLESVKIGGIRRITVDQERRFLERHASKVA